MEIIYDNKRIKMTGEEILDRQERWMQYNLSKIALWDCLTEEHYKGGHDADDPDDCEECNSQFDIESVERRCDEKSRV